MKIKTSELIGPALDWAVAKCEKQPFPHVYEYDGPVEFTPSTDWAQGGPIIEREKISTVNQGHNSEWIASIWDYATQNWHQHMIGPNPLIAAMRCYVASKLGDEVEIPNLV